MEEIGIPFVLRAVIMLRVSDGGVVISNAPDAISLK